MALITIRGIRLKQITITPAEDDGKIQCSYQLISSADKVLAEQTIGSYGASLKVAPSPATIKALEAFTTAYRNDVNMVLGLDAE